MARSIADGPVAAAVEAPGAGPSLRPTPARRAAVFIAAARDAAANGLTWSEFGDLSLALVKLLVEAYEDFMAYSGAQKKAAVLDAVGELFDAVADKAVPTVAWPVWYVARPAVRALVLALAGGAVEAVLPLVRR